MMTSLTIVSKDVTLIPARNMYTYIYDADVLHLLVNTLTSMKLNLVFSKL